MITETPVPPETTHDHLADAAFFTSLNGAALRPGGAFHFEGPQGRYTLTWRQEAFARHYVSCGNGAEAARRAGYSVQSARFIAHENLQNSKLRWRVRALAAQAEARRRDETAYLLQMLNAAMEMALAQGQPNAMIRALGQMARLSGLDRPPTPLSSGREEDMADGLDAEATLALMPAVATGLLQEAVLGTADPASAAPEPGVADTWASLTDLPESLAELASSGPLPNIPLHCPTVGENLAANHLTGPPRPCPQLSETLIGSGRGPG